MHYRHAHERAEFPAWGRRPLLVLLAVVAEALEFFRVRTGVGQPESQLEHQRALAPQSLRVDLLPLGRGIY